MQSVYETEADREAVEELKEEYAKVKAIRDVDSGDWADGEDAYDRELDEALEHLADTVGAMLEDK